MHVADGVLSPSVWIGGYAVTAIFSAAIARKINPGEIPRMAIMTSVFFIASLVHVPVGPVSTHLMLSGLTGILLGPAAFIAVFLGLILQALLFQHGGITTIGVNCLIMGIPAVAAGGIFRLGGRLRFKAAKAVFAGLAGGAAVFAGALILAVVLVMSGEEFKGVALMAFAAHVPLMIIEAVISGGVVSFLIRVKPEVLSSFREAGHPVAEIKAGSGRVNEGGRK